MHLIFVLRGNYDRRATQRRKEIRGTGKSGKRHYYYSCKSALKKECHKNYVRRDPLEDRIVDECRNILTDENIAIIAKELSALCEREANSPYTVQLKKELAKLDAAIENLMQALELGEEADLIIERVKAKKNERQNLEAQLKEVELTQVLLEESQIRFFLTDLRKGDINDPKYRKMLINVLVNKIYLYDDKITIFFNVTDGKPIEITKEIRDEVGCSYSALMVGEEGFEPPTLCL